MRGPLLSTPKGTVDTTGCINWPRTGELTWTDTRQGCTHVWAYWPVDRQTEGMDLFDQNSVGRDWFLADEAANMQGLPLLNQDEYPSPNHAQVENASGVLAAILLGTAAGTYRSDVHGGYFWAGPSDLTADGKKLVTTLSGLYRRRPVIITYLAMAPRPSPVGRTTGSAVEPMNQAVPGAALDPATVVAVSGHSSA